MTKKAHDDDEFLHAVKALRKAMDAEAADELDHMQRFITSTPEEMRDRLDTWLRGVIACYAAPDHYEGVMGGEARDALADPEGFRAAYEAGEPIDRMTSCASPAKKSCSASISTSGRGAT